MESHLILKNTQSERVANSNYIERDTTVLGIS